MPSELDPYRSPPPAELRFSWLWDHSVLSQAAYGVQTLVLLAYCFLTVQSEKPVSEAILAIDPTFHVAMAVCAVLAFVVVFASTVAKRDWPLHLRGLFIGLDLLFLGVLTYVSHAFGTL